jgi:hypothetical protein
MGEGVHQHDHHQVGTGQRETRADDPERRDQRHVEGDVDEHARHGRREAALGAASAAEDHDHHQVQGIEGDACGEQTDRLVRLEELVGGEQPGDLA